MNTIQDVAAERDNLMQVLGELRVTLGTPDDVDVTVWAAQVAAKAAKWDAVPWGALDGVLFGLAVFAHPFADDEAEVQAFYDAHKPGVSND